MGVFEWLIEKPRRDYFDYKLAPKPAQRETFTKASSTVKRSDVTIMNMRVGDYVTYRGTDYFVRQRYLYRARSYEWISYQFSDSSRKNELWLDVEDDDQVNIEITEPIKLPPDLTIPHLKAKKPFTLNGEVFLYDEHGQAEVKIEKEGNSWDSDIVEYWDYYNKDETKFISIEKWGDEVEASTGHPIKEFELEIYPGS